MKVLILANTLLLFGAIETSILEGWSKLTAVGGLSLTLVILVWRFTASWNKMADNIGALAKSQNKNHHEMMEAHRDAAERHIGVLEKALGIDGNATKDS